VGADVGGKSVQCGLFRGEDLVGCRSFKTGADVYCMLSGLIDSIRCLLGDSNLVSGDVSGFGFGFPAFKSPESGFYRFPNISGGDDVDLAGLLMKSFGERVVVGNDADYTAYGASLRLGEFEVLKGGAGSDSMVSLVLVTIGSGIGGGVIVECAGRRDILSGGGLCELGHVRVVDAGRVCGCGKRGCVEAYSSCSAQRKAALEAIPGFSGDAAEVDRMSREGFEPAVKVMGDAGHYLGVALANIINVLNPSILAFSGGGANSPGDGVFFSSMLGALEAGGLPEDFDAVSVVKNPDAKGYGVYGAAMRAGSMP
jgi:glucokinase